MLRPLIQVLRKNGIPFHNPFRLKSGLWNPLRQSKNRVSASDRLRGFLQMSEIGEWSKESLERWLDCVKTKDVIVRQGQEWLEIFDDRWLSIEDLALILTDDAIGAGTSGNVSWLANRLWAKNQRAMEFTHTN